MAKFALLSLGCAVGFVLGIRFHVLARRQTLSFLAICAAFYAILVKSSDSRPLLFGLLIGLLLTHIRSHLTIVTMSYSQLQPRPGEFDDDDLRTATLQVVLLLSACAIVTYFALVLHQ